MSTPFGKPFHYTTDLPTSVDRQTPWYKRLFRRKKREPIGWAVVDPCSLPPKSSRVFSVHATAIVPVYDENVLLGLDEGD